MEQSFELYLQNAEHKWLNLTERNQENKQSDKLLISRIFPFLLRNIYDHIYFSSTYSDSKGWLSRDRISACGTGQKNAIMAPEFLPHYTVPNVNYIYRLQSDVF